MQVAVGDLLKVKIPLKKSVSFFESDTSIGEVIQAINDKIIVKIGDETHEITFDMIVNKVEKMSKSKM